ncbi:hypothetical protein GCM10018790_70790 [Kitasatospora xanthocidica]|uniref:hypothetical protein n=1 Tax=Kitasatospora xanthocidica TaxID=83382 RepID=UPI00167309F8|nr:hypothetical protein [Kitasatospora xanthocidica]GHF82898.1 hypothetical protein GCM10018790_70790 [Kitasatospora xanthocidica]
MVTRIGAGARGLGIGMAAIVLGGALSACGSSAVSGELAAGAQKWADFTTVLSDKVALKQTLPGRAAMPGWEVHNNKVSVKDGTDEDCPGCKLEGTADFEDGTVTATFNITTFATKEQAGAYLAKTATAFEKKAESPAKLAMPTIGSETVAYGASSRKGPRNIVLMRVGTTFAGVMLQESSDVKQLEKLATVLARRVEQTAAGQTPDAALDAR